MGNQYEGISHRSLTHLLEVKKRELSSAIRLQKLIEIRSLESEIEELKAAIGMSAQIKFQ